MGNKSIEKARG